VCVSVFFGGGGGVPGWRRARSSDAPVAGPLSRPHVLASNVVDG
jgi:hypothetical protein